MPVTHHVRLTQLGWDADLQIEERHGELPDPSRDHIRVQVEACGVCYRDVIDRDGRFKFIQVPITPGHEVVGRVTAVGPDVTDWAVGDRVGTMHRDFCGRCAACKAGDASACSRAMAVLGLVIDGGYASTMTAPERCFYRVPDALPAEEAAVMHCTHGTAYRALTHSGGLEAGQQVVVTGANGGVGTAAVQVAERLGAKVTAVVRDPSHREMLSALGAETILIDEGGSFHKLLRRDPVDVAVDCVGSPTFNASLRSLRPGGRLVVVGNVTRERAALNLGYVVTRGLHIVGSAGATRDDMAALLDLHLERPFKVQIDARLDLAEADRAQRRVRAGGLRGRIVLVPPRASG